MAVRVDLTLPAKLVCAAGEALALMALGGFLVAGATGLEAAADARAAARFLRCAASLVAAVFAAGFFGAAFFAEVFLVATLLPLTIAGAGSAAVDGLATGAVRGAAGFAERFSDCLTLLSDLRVERRWDRASILRVCEVGFPLDAAADAAGADARAPWNVAKASLNA